MSDSEDVHPPKDPGVSPPWPIPDGHFPPPPEIPWPTVPEDFPKLNAVIPPSPPMPVFSDLPALPSPTPPSPNQFFNSAGSEEVDFDAFFDFAAYCGEKSKDAQKSDNETIRKSADEAAGKHVTDKGTPGKDAKEDGKEMVMRAKRAKAKEDAGKGLEIWEK
ncbi:Protein nud1 [Hypoxylon texense]